MKRISFIVAVAIAFTPAYAQEFLSKYEKLSPRDLKSFVDDWYSWSCETHPDVAAKTAIDTVLCKAFEKLYWPREQEYFVLPDRITVCYHTEPFGYLRQDADLSIQDTTDLLPPPPPPGTWGYDINNTLDHKELISPPYKIHKKALYLTRDIEQVLWDFIDKYDKTGNWKATRLLGRYFRTGPNRKIRTAPEIIQIYVYPNAYVVPYARDICGASLVFSLDFEYIRDTNRWER